MMIWTGSIVRQAIDADPEEAIKGFYKRNIKNRGFLINLGRFIKSHYPQYVELAGKYGILLQ
jgi:hypothetical protein